jgi:murein DD-endopeptidase MepM/ murein hydrolase activator NlpD
MKKKRPDWIKKLRSRYRVMLLNDIDFQERISVRLTPLSVIMIVTTGFMLFFLASWLLIYTVPALRMYMPGYEPDQERKFKNDMLNQLIEYEETISRLEEKEILLKILLRGDDLSETDLSILQDHIDQSEIKRKVNEQDSGMERESKMASILYSDPGDNVFAMTSEIGNPLPITSHFFVPIKGQTIARFEKNNLRVLDIFPDKDQTIKSVLDGTVLFETWTPTFAHVIYIQHPENWVSVYKNCSSVIKKKGDRVKAGEIIAMVGEDDRNTSSKTLRNKLHFELWHNGNALNPSEFISFR